MELLEFFVKTRHWKNGVAACEPFFGGYVRRLN